MAEANPGKVQRVRSTSRPGSGSSGGRQQNHRPVSSRPRQISETDCHGMGDKTCIVCYKDVKYFSVGPCDHSVCFECSSRMRVLMEQMECPICRQKIEHVVFTRVYKNFKDMKDKLRMFIYLPQWGIYLEDERLQQDFERLLEHRCPFCEDIQQFREFYDLKIHIQRTHDLFACDLCADNIKLFSMERRFYSRPDLAHHKRKGDRNDKSHRGHPLCQFCDRRYFDQDELYKHLRKDHYFCHFCDADGFNHYYNTYDDLRIHFRREHFLCEEEHCKDEKFTSCFRTEIDMKAHLTAAHSRLLGKHGVKQARIIDVEFNMKPDEERRSRRFGLNRDGFVGTGNGRDRGGDRRTGRDNYEQEELQAPPVFEPTVQPKVDSVQDFPCLEGAGVSRVMPVTNGASHANSSIAQKVALNSGRNVTTSGTSGPPGSGPRWNAKVTGSSKHDEEFPALGPGPRSSASTSSNHQQPPSRGLMSAAVTVKKPPSPPKTKPNAYAGRSMSNGLLNAHEEFPSLGNPTGSSNGSAWKGSGVKMKHQTPRSLKIAPAPLERKIEVDPYDQFHFVPLSVSRARKDSLTKKYENFADDDVSPIVLSNDEPETEKAKKKKAKGDSVSSTAKAAAALFNGGQHVGGKSKVSKGGASNNNSNGKVNIKKSSEEFPSLEPVKKSLPLSNSASSPALSGSSGSGNNSRAQPNIAGISVSGPPPGFLAKSSEDQFDMSFLNSSKKSIGKAGNNNNINILSEDLELAKAKRGSSGKLYIQPPEFTKRNQRLVEGIRTSLSADESSFDMFRSVSNQYKKGEISSKEFYELCQDMFGMTDFRVIFPELLSLLPDIEKQQELLSSHRRAGGIMAGLSSCQECFQVIKAGDLSAHIKSHSAGDLFPALGKSRKS